MFCNFNLKYTFFTDEEVPPAEEADEKRDKNPTQTRTNPHQSKIAAPSQQAEMHWTWKKVHHLTQVAHKNFNVISADEITHALSFLKNVLPPLECKQDIPLSTSGSVNTFADLTNAKNFKIALIFTQLKKLQNTFDAPLLKRKLAHHINSMLRLHSYLYTFREVECYLADPTNYEINRKSSSKFTPVLTKRIREGDELIRELLSRIVWLINLIEQQSIPFNIPESCVNTLIIDKTWLQKADSFIQQSSQEIVQLKSHQRFPDFLKVSPMALWPHSPELLASIQNAGFECSPTLDNPDRCICKECGVVVTDWRPWQHPLASHNLESSKHTQAFKTQTLDVLSRLGNPMSPPGPIDAKDHKVIPVKIGPSPASPVLFAQATVSAEPGKPKKIHYKTLGCAIS